LLLCWKKCEFVFNLRHLILVPNQDVSCTEFRLSWLGIRFICKLDRFPKKARSLEIHSVGREILICGVPHFVIRLRNMEACSPYLEQPIAWSHRLLVFLQAYSTHVFVGLGALTEVVMYRSIFWDITQCNPLRVNRRFGRKSVDLQRTTPSYIPDDRTVLQCIESAYFDEI
jgi:hypothetical protein